MHRNFAVAANTAKLAIAQDAAPTFALAAEDTSFNEGSSDLFTLTTTGIAAGTVYNYALTGLPAADFANGEATGSVTIGADGIAYINVTVEPGVLSASTALTLTVAGVSDVVTVNDTSSPVTGSYSLSTGADQIVTPSTGSFTIDGALGQLTNTGREALGTFSVGDSITGDGAGTTLLINQNKINTDDPAQEYDLVPIGIQLTNVGTIVIDSVQALGTGSAVFDLTTNAQNNTSFSGLGEVTVSNSSGNDFVSVSGTTSLNLIDTSGSVTTEGGANVTIETFDPVSGSANVTIGSGPNGAPTGAILVRDFGTGTVTTFGGTDVAVHLGAGQANGGVNISGETGKVSVDGGSSATALAGTVSIFGGATDTVVASGAVTIDSQAAGAAAGQPGISVTETGANATVSIGTLGANAPSYDPAGNVVVTDMSPSGAYNAGIVTIDTNGANTVQVTGGSAGGITDYQATLEGGVSSLSTVTLTAVAGTETITSGALNTLNVFNSWVNAAGDTAVVVNAAGTQALSLTMRGDIGLNLTDNAASAINVAAYGTNPGLVLSAANARTVSITGTTVLALQGASLGNLTTLNISGGAGFTDAGAQGAGADALAGYAALTTINGAASTNALTATINAHQAFTGGSGSDTVTISADQLVTDNLGTGASNTLIANNIGSTFTAANTGANVSGYSKLETTASAAGTYDLLHVFDGVATVEMTAAPTKKVVFSNASATQTLAIDASLTQKVVLDLPAKVAGKLLTLDLGTRSTSGIDTSKGSASAVGKLALSAEKYTSATINSIGTGGGTNKTVLGDNRLGENGGTLTINGNESLDIGTALAAGQGNVAIIDVGTSFGTTVDLTHLGTTSNGVSLMVADGSVVFDGYAGSIKTDTVTAGSGSNVITEKGAGGLIVTAQDGNNTISSVGGVLNVTLGNGNNSVIGNNATALIVEGDGTDTVSVGTGSPSLSETVTLGSGNFDTVAVGSVRAGASDTITLGNGFEDTVKAGGGAMKITLGNGNLDTVTTGSGPDTISMGNGNDTITVGGGANSITAGAGADTIVLGAGANTISANVGAASPGGVTISFSGASTAANTITLGNGHNVIQGGSLAEGSNTLTLGNGANTVALGDGNNTITAGNGTNVFTLGNGANTLSTGSGSNAISLGSGANVVNLAAHPAATDKISFLTDATSGIDKIGGLAHGDSLLFQPDGTEVWNGGSAAHAQVIEPPNAQFLDYLNAACFGNGSANGVFSWFQYGSNTFLVEDRSSASTYVASSDLVVQLNGNQSSLILGSTLNGMAHTLKF